MFCWQAPPLGRWVTNALMNQHLPKIVGGFYWGVNAFDAANRKRQSGRGDFAGRIERPAKGFYMDDTMEIITPAATAEPITPATFGPMACISR